MKMNFESKPVYGDDERQMPKEKAPCKCLSIKMIDSVIKVNKKHYPQTLLQECKYIQEKIKTENYINEDLENSESDNETKSDTDELFVKGILSVSLSRYMDLIVYY